MYNCPHTVRARGFEQILCTKLLKGGVIPQNMVEKAQACCAHQYYCPLTGKWEHTHGSTTCKLQATGGET